MVTVSVTVPPTQNVTVALSADNTDVQINPGAAQVTLSRSNPFINVSVRYANPRFSNTENVMVSATSSSSEPDYDNLQASREITFMQYDWISWKISTRTGPATPIFYSSRITIAMNLRENQNVAADRRTFGISTQEDHVLTAVVTFSVSITGGPGERVTIRNNPAVISYLNFVDSNEVSMEVSLIATGGPAATVSLEFEMTTSDGLLALWQELADDPTFGAYGEIRISPGLLRLDMPSAVQVTAAGQWIEATVWLDSAPSGGDNVNVVFGSDDSNVMFDPTEVDLSDTTPVVVSLQYTEEITDPAGVSLDLTFETTSADGDYNDLSITRALVLSTGAQGNEVHLGKVLAAADLGSAQFALDMVGSQVGNAPSAGLNLSMPPAVVVPDDTWTPAETGWRSDFSSLAASGSGFALPFGRDSDVFMWASLGYYDFSGNSLHEGDVAEYDGDALGVIYGVGWRQPNETFYGLALSHTDSDTDFDNANDLASVNNKMTTLHPYFGMELGNSTRAWIVGGIGRGEVSATLENGSTIETDKSSGSIGAVVERSWEANDIDFTARLEGIGGQSELKASQAFTDAAIVEDDGSPIKSDVLRVRFEIEAGKDFNMEQGGVVSPFVLVGGRHDGGDLDGGNALELGGGVRMHLTDSYSIDIKGRVQVNDTDHNEHSLVGRFNYDSRGDRRGLVVSFSQELDSDGLVNKGRVGYGWGARLMGNNGVFGPSLVYGSDGALARFGFDSDAMWMGLEGSDEEVEITFDFIFLGPR